MDRLPATGAVWNEAGCSTHPMPAAVLDALLNDVFPFHVRVDGQLCLESWGRSTSKILGPLQSGTPLRALLRIESPSIALSAEALTKARDEKFFCAVGHAGVQLRGQFWPTPEGGLIFLCTPSFERRGIMDQMGIYEDDFAPHEATVDYMSLRSVRRRQVEQLQEDNRKLCDAMLMREPGPSVDNGAENTVLLETLEQAMEAVIMVDDAGTITFFNQAARILFGYARCDAVGKPIDLLSCGDGADSTWLDTSNGSHYRGEVTLCRFDRSTVLCSFSVSRVTTGESALITAFIQDITQQRRTEQRMTHQANHDGLTGLANRRGFQRHLEAQFENGRRRHTAVALVDLDNFKAVNDLLGHGAGDQFLKLTAQRINNSIRDSDFACRLGGDEFAIVLSGAESRDAADRIMHRVLSDLQQPMTIDNVQWMPAASVGVAIGEACATADDALHNADLAMYEAKALGKGRVYYFTETLSRRALARVDLQRRLKDALEAGEIVAFYQPVIDLTAGRVKGFEALARWTPPDADPISPAEFIPVAETSDLILDLEKVVLDHALTTLAQLRQGEPTLTINVNISPRHVAHGSLVPTVAGMLDKHGVPATALTLELTESTLLGDSVQVSDQFARLRNLGVRLALDDFGTGYSSLSYLERYSFDVLKIDRSFVTDIAQTNVRRRLVEIMLSVGQVMEMDVVAEGIETVSDQSVLQSMNCRYGQGFLYAAPLPATAVAGFLRDCAQKLLPDAKRTA